MADRADDRPPALRPHPATRGARPPATARTSPASSPATSPATKGPASGPAGSASGPVASPPGAPQPRRAAPANPARTMAPPTSPPVFFECWKCGYSFDGLAIHHNVACPECGFVLRRRLARGRCPCGGELPDPGADGLAHCPSCGRGNPARVPDSPWPFRCARCRCDLTGQPIDSGRVRCPACEEITRWGRGPGAGLSPRQATMALLKPTLIFAAVLAVIGAIIIAVFWGWWQSPTP